MPMLLVVPFHKAKLSLGHEIHEIKLYNFLGGSASPGFIKRSIILQVSAPPPETAKYLLKNIK